MNGKGKGKNFVVAFHDDSINLIFCLGVYKKWETALGVCYEYILTKSEEGENYYKNFSVSLPVVAEGESAWIVSYSYEDMDGEVYKGYLIIYDNRLGEDDLAQINKDAAFGKMVKLAKAGRLGRDKESA